MKIVLIKILSAKYLSASWEVLFIYFIIANGVPDCFKISSFLFCLTQVFCRHVTQFCVLCIDLIAPFYLKTCRSSYFHSDPAFLSLQNKQVSLLLQLSPSVYNVTTQSLRRVLQLYKSVTQCQ